MKKYRDMVGMGRLRMTMQSCSTSISHTHIHVHILTRGVFVCKFTESVSAGKDGKPTDTRQAVHITFVDGSALLKIEIPKFVVYRNKKVKKYGVFCNIEVFLNPDIKVSLFTLPFSPS